MQLRDRSLRQNIALLPLHMFALVGVAFLLDDLHREELLRVDLVQPHANAHRQSRP